MMNRSLLQSSTLLTTRWVRLWFYIVGAAILIGGISESVSSLLVYGAILLLAGGIIQGIGSVLERMKPASDNYAASVHRAMIERFFVQTEATRDVTKSIPEAISRTSFYRPSKTRPLQEAYQSLTIVIVLVSAATVLYYSFSADAVYALSTVLFVVYVTDRWFGLRSYLYFKTQNYSPEENTDYLEAIVDLFSEELELKESPEIIYSDNDDFIAGATNPSFRSAQLYISTSLLDKQRHIQTGLVSHEMAHIKSDETKLYTHKHIQYLIPLSILVFGAVPLSILSVVGLASGLLVIMVGVAVKRHREEFEADSIASELTQVENIVLAILEFTNYNPFVESLPKPFAVLTTFVSTHPPTSERLQQLVRKYGQSFNSEYPELSVDDTKQRK